MNNDPNESNDKKNDKEENDKESENKDEELQDSPNAHIVVQISKSTQTKPHGTGQIAAITRSSPSFVSRTLTVIQDEGNQELPNQTAKGSRKSIVQIDERRDLHRKSIAGSMQRHPSRLVASRGTQADLAETTTRSVHQVMCARSHQGAQACKGSAHKGPLGQRGCCADEVRVTADGVVMGCCANEPRADNAPAVYQCRKATGFPDSVYPASSGLFCCHGTWREDTSATQGAARENAEGVLPVRSFVGMCCTHVLPESKEVDEAGPELTTAVVELETSAENDSVESKSDKAKL